MEFSKRIAVIAGVATWGCVVLGVVAALLTVEFVPQAPVDLPRVWAWTAFGAVLATLTTVLAVRAQQAGSTLTQTVTVGRVVLVANVVYITGLACASGGAARVRVGAPRRQRAVRLAAVHPLGPRRVRRPPRRQRRLHRDRDAHLDRVRACRSALVALVACRP